MLTHDAMRGCGLTPWVVCINDKFHDIRKSNVTNKKWDLNYEHPFPRVSGHKRVCDIVGVVIREVRVYLYARNLPRHCSSWAAGRAPDVTLWRVLKISAFRCRVLQSSFMELSVMASFSLAALLQTRETRFPSATIFYVTPAWKGEKRLHVGE